MNNLLTSQDFLILGIVPDVTLGDPSLIHSWLQYRDYGSKIFRIFRLLTFTQWCFWLTCTHVLWWATFFFRDSLSSLLTKTFTLLYSTWAAKEGPKRDSYNISDNPQFRLEIRANQPAAVWILLTRHITDKVQIGF